MAEDYIEIYRALVESDVERRRLDIAKPPANLNTNGPRLLIA
jgi:hypothetical protein